MSTWYQVFQQAATVMVPSLILLLNILKTLESALSMINQQNFDYEFVSYQKEAKLRQINLFEPENKGILNEVIQEISKKGIIS